MRTSAQKRAQTRTSTHKHAQACISTHKRTQVNASTRKHDQNAAEYLDVLGRATVRFILSQKIVQTIFNNSIIGHGQQHYIIQIQTLS